MEIFAMAVFMIGVIGLGCVVLGAFGEETDAEEIALALSLSLTIFGIAGMALI